MFRTLQSRRYAGFSLTELVVVLAVIALVSAIAVPTFSTVRTNSAQRVAVTSAEAVARNAFALALQDSTSGAVSVGGFQSGLVRSVAESSRMDFTDGVSDPVGVEGSLYTWSLTHANGRPALVSFDEERGGVSAGPASPAQLSVSYGPVVFSLGSPQSFAPSLAGASPSAVFSFDGLLPDGVSFDPSSGTFSTAGLVGVSDGLRDVSFQDPQIDVEAMFSNEGAFLPYGSGALSVDVQPDDGRLVVAGRFVSVAGQDRGRMVRLNVDGTTDVSFQDPNVNGDVHRVRLQPDGRMVIVGGFSSVSGQPRDRVARLNPDGTLDGGFAVSVQGGTLAEAGSVSGSLVFALALQPDGRIVIGGDFTEVAGQPRLNIARLNADGTLDLSFDSDVVGTVYDVVLLPDGKMLIAGNFTEVAGQVRHRVARLNADGTLDAAFVTPNVASTVFALAVQPDGKVLVGGLFNSVAGQTRNRVARLSADGTLDVSFQNPDVSGTVRVLAVQQDGSVIVGGDFTAVAGVSRNYVALLGHDGLLDAGFDPSATSDLDPGSKQYTVRSVVVRPDGRVILGGSFTQMGGVPQSGVAMLGVVPPSGFPFSGTVTVSDGASSVSTEVTVTLAP
jgi:uncharacterized delta-60 repeat protein/prepilin-type N-terminal cleavage/methylation domain-containing protein